MSPTISQEVKRPLTLKEKHRPAQKPLLLEITAPTPVADDRYTALKCGQPELGSPLWSLKEYAGDTQTYCRYRIESLGHDVVVPGLNNPVYGVYPVPSYGANLQPTDIELIRLPKIYEVLNQALIAQLGQRQQDWEFSNSSLESAYDWERERARVKTALADLATKVIETTALRPRLGIGFQALAQANPLLTQRELGLGKEMAEDVLRDVQRREIQKYGRLTGRFTSIGDLAGLKLKLVIRFPATTSFSVRLDMHIVICGRGRCCYLNPVVLKGQMKGDVDGDLLFNEIDERLITRELVHRFIEVPRKVTLDNLKADYSLADIGAQEKANDLKAFEGMAGKEGIGEITNLFYRGIVVIHIAFQESFEKRAKFWSHVNRPDLADRILEGDDEEANRRQFRHLSARVLMDSFTAFYEGTFDLRKDDKIRPYLEHLLRAIRGQEPIKFWELAQMEWEGKPVDVVPMAVMWDSARVDDKPGKVTSFVSQYPVQDLFFRGRGVTVGKRLLFEKIMKEFPQEDLVDRVYDEVNGVSHTKSESGSVAATGDEFVF